MQEYSLFFDAKRYFYNNTGLGNYSRWLVDSLAELYPDQKMTLLKPKKKTSSFLANTIDVKNLNVQEYNNLFSYNRTFKLYDQCHSKYAIYHGLSNEIPFQKKRRHLKSMVTIHDVIFLHRPQDYKRIDVSIYNYKTKNAVTQADCIIAISQQTKNDICNKYKIDEHKVYVVYQNCNKIFYQDVKSDVEQQIKSNLPKDYFICVSSFNGRKNQMSILNAIKLIPAENRIPVLFVGKGNEFKNFMNQVHYENLQKWLIPVELNDIEMLKIYYKHAKASIYPSLIEGFGIPVVESLALGTPVIFHNSAWSVQEACGEAGLAVDTLNAEELADAMLQMTSQSNIRDLLIENASKHLKTISTETQIFKQKALYDQLFS